MWVFPRVEKAEDWTVDFFLFFCPPERALKHSQLLSDCVQFSNLNGFWRRVGESGLGGIFLTIERIAGTFYPPFNCPFAYHNFSFSVWFDWNRRDGRKSPFPESFTHNKSQQQLSMCPYHHGALSRRRGKKLSIFLTSNQHFRSSSCAASSLFSTLLIPAYIQLQVGSYFQYTLHDMLNLSLLLLRRSERSTLSPAREFMRLSTLNLRPSWTDDDDRRREMKSVNLICKTFFFPWKESSVLALINFMTNFFFMFLMKISFQKNLSFFIAWNFNSIKAIV